MTTSSVLFSPLLSSQVIVTFSPGLPPLKRKCRKGLRETEVPHCADSTVLPPCATVTFRMKCAGMALPLASLRRPVSISWAISTFTSTLSPVMFARMRMGSAISASAPADGDLDFLHRVKILAVRDHERIDIRRFGHLDARADEGVGAGWDLEFRGQGVRVLFDQDGDGLRPGELALHRDRHDCAVFRDIRGGDLDSATRARSAAAQGLTRVGDALGVERRLVPFLRERLAGLEDPGRSRQREHTAPGLQYFAPLGVHESASLDVRYRKGRILPWLLGKCDGTRTVIPAASCVRVVNLPHEQDGEPCFCRDPQR